MAFKHYNRAEHNTHARKTGNIASLYTSGMLQFRGTSTALLEGIQDVEAYYDADTRTIGLMPSTRTPTTIRIQRQRDGRAQIGLKTFARAFDISLDKTSHYQVRREETGMITITPIVEQNQSRQEDRTDNGQAPAAEPREPLDHGWTMNQ